MRQMTTYRRSDDFILECLTDAEAQKSQSDPYTACYLTDIAHPPGMRRLGSALSC
ncbi:uncharacterized protein L969DRAFT_87964 [Mixia osmundae IAM 14324]|uniref:uncharacterized protein n=1 Tax=Mixia osmundae (strain CBS 9802 / IAM 14324 / JCM 22182 / KY 12970) TaxID=764103 RepID=UPI0004A559AE|nr:uncharacterized protein L969DRAFT_87964 [Mixia osmundae IAM 14324]KEI38713.1 hypothetical protein L969DRAFT_87964 [Mixia osmundae IAM 14324]